jgi:hypothetical protein
VAEELLDGADGVVADPELGTDPIHEAAGTPGRGPRKVWRGIHMV